MALPELPATSREAWLTVRATLAEDAPWAPAGHEVAWGQVQVGRGDAGEDGGGGATPDEGAGGGGRTAAGGRAGAGDIVSLGSARFDARTGMLRALGDLELEGPRLDIWRAPTDNDRGMHGDEQLEAAWRRLGLHRARHRVIAVDAGPERLAVRTRVGMGAWDGGLLTTYTWRRRATGCSCASTWSRRASGRCRCRGSACASPCPPRSTRVEWFGRGPGEAYPDTRLAARVGRFAASVDELQTPYVRPQENGARTEVRWATLTDATARACASRAARTSAHGAPLADRGPRRGDAHARARAARPRLGQPRPRRAGHRLRLVRAGRASRLPAGAAAGELRRRPARAARLSDRGRAAAARSRRRAALDAHVRPLATAPRPPGAGSPFAARRRALPGAQPGSPFAARRRALPGRSPGSPFAAVTPAYQRALSLGVRSSVS